MERGRLGLDELKDSLSHEIARLLDWLAQRAHFAAVLLAFLVVYGLAANAWVTEDAYISLRSVEQVHAGNGPRWNPHERVQAYTHTLWFWVLCLARLVISDGFLLAIAVGITFSLASFWLLYSRLAARQGALVGALAVLCLLSSKALMDYTTSGLENPLSAFLLLIALFASQRWVEGPVSIPALFLAFGALFLLATNRLDSLTLTLPLLAFLAWSAFAEIGLTKTVGVLTLASLPLVTSEVFSLLYYGFLFPNTAYSKVANGVGLLPTLASGARYLVVSSLLDPLLPVVLIGALWIAKAKKALYWRALGAGVLLNLLYLALVGGDFMAGRFLTSSFIVGVFVLMKNLDQTGFARLGLFLVLLSFSPLHPLNPFADRHLGAPILGVADERAFYSDYSSVESCFVAWAATGECPAHPWYEEGRRFASSPEKVLVARNVGFLGYRAGTEKIVVDELALADPLLARLPVGSEGRVGHLVRELPEGYVESLRSGENRLQDPHLREYYDHLRVLTQAPIFSPGRLSTILKFNLGLYDSSPE